MRVLLTAFEPFGGHTANSSLTLLEQLGALGEHLVLPVSFRRAPQLALEAIERKRPRVIISLGQAAARPDICLERVALNLMHASTPDNDGFRPQRQPVIAGAPDGIFTPFNVDTLAEQIGAKVSNTAGLYVCNALYYTLLHRNLAPALFIHLPSTLPADAPEMLKMLINTVVN